MIKKTTRPEVARGPDGKPFMGTLKLGDKEIAVYHLTDASRAVSMGSMGKAFDGTAHGGSKARARAEKLIGGDGPVHLPAFLANDRIFPFLTAALVDQFRSPLVFPSPHGGLDVVGVRVESLADICDALIDARDAGSLRDDQVKLAVAARTMMRAFSKVGLVALADEATGYQQHRDSRELRDLVGQLLQPELQPWMRRFPDDFFIAMDRVGFCKVERFTKQDGSDGVNPKGMGKAAQFIRERVYGNLPDGVIDRLHEYKGAVIANGHKRPRLHRFFREGSPVELLDHVIDRVTMALMLAGTGPNRMARAMANLSQFEKDHREKMRLYGQLELPVDEHLDLGDAEANP